MTSLAFRETPRRKFPISVDMFHLMGRSGAIDPDERVELIDGELFEMSPIGSLHARCVKFLTDFLINLYSGRFVIGVQDPIVLNDRSEPQPDIAILKHRSDFYKEALPEAADVFLIIEVSDSTVDFDRIKKLPRYAAAGIPETWLVDLESDLVEVHFVPKEATYGTVKIYQRGETVVSETLSEISVMADDILG